MTTYFRDDSIMISSTAIQIGTRSFPLDDLEAVWLERGPWQPGRALVMIALWTAAAVAGIALLADIVAVVADPHDPLGDRAAPAVAWFYLLASPVLLGALFIGAERARERGGRVMRLCATLGGRSYALFSTCDATRFGQVQRALLRALEHRRR